MDDRARLADDGLPPLREVIRAHGLRAKKSLGQNFILDLNLTRRIARACGDLSDAVVVEVGPGPGGLTRALLSEGAGHVFAVERDQRCLEALAIVGAHWPDRLTVEYADALAFPWQSVRSHFGDVGDRKVFVIANLPYGIATSLLIGWLSSPTWPPWYNGMALMFQKEVADRIVASPGTKAYGRLSVIAQWSCEVDIALNLPAAAFTPPPKVASAVVRFVPRAARLPDCSVNALERVTAAAFGQRRKMLRVSLKQLTPFPELLLDRVGIDPEIRAEQVDVEGFARLAAALDGVMSADGAAG